jgi:Putative transposase of IS4/5 family (DUF4096)
LFQTRSGVPWRDLPERYGPWQAVYKRFARWQTDGTWVCIEAALRTQADAAGELDWAAQIDSSVVRAHQHAAGPIAWSLCPLYDGEDPLLFVLGWVGVKGGHRGMLDGAVGPVPTAYRK